MSKVLSDVDRNADVWRRIYAEGSNDLLYPNDVFVRLCYRYLNPAEDVRALDHGFGTGANLIHLALRGFEVAGTEVSPHALEKTRERIAAQGLKADLKLIDPGARLPFPDAAFHAVISWQVLCYNDWPSFQCALDELNRVLRPGGKFLAATCAPGDVSHQLSDSLGSGLHRSRVPGQEGCIMVIPDESQLRESFAGRQLEIGKFGYEFNGSVSRHWLITYRKD